MKIGIIGCGNISSAYLRQLQKAAGIEVLACADLDIERAAARAAEFDIPHAVSPADLLNDQQIKLIVNLTHPAAHAEVTLAAIEAGKHVYSEKPLATFMDDAAVILERAAARNIEVGCAPDSWLQPNIQSLKRAVDTGVIGEVIAGRAVFLSPGHEHWHTNPEFYYRAGGGPLMDMGPYYITTLVNLFGPVERVFARGKASSAERVITARASRQYGQVMPVEVATHISTILTFPNDLIVELTTSFDVWHSTQPDIEIYGEVGSLMLGKAGIYNNGISSFMRLKDAEMWTPLKQDHKEDVKFGIGVVDMVHAIANGGTIRANAQLARHVLGVLLALLRSVDQGCEIILDMPHR